jgi:hypothetical protein
MDIKVITRHGPSNYGSLLQSIATLSILGKLGHNVEIIDYQRQNERGVKAVCADVNHKAGWNNPIKKLIYVAIRFPMEWIAQHKFDSMRKKYLKMTKRCENTKDLKKLRADIFMTGSDQVWGPVLTDAYDKNYFLDFVDEDTKKVAYAASFGKTEFVDTTVAAYKKMLTRYSCISVRENSAQKLLEKWNIPCVGQVLDPTMLLTSEEWSKFIKKNRSSGYVLVYQLHNNVQLSSYAKSFAKEVNLPLYRVSPSLHQFNRGGKFIYLPDLGDFLSAIKNCSYLITDSFHGTCFAINFNRPFIEILPNNKTGSRNQSILELTGLMDRIVFDYTDYSIKDKIIDYNKVNDIIQAERNISMNILKDMLRKKL